MLRIGRIGRDRRRLPAPPRARPPAVAVGHQLPRQYRRHEAGRRHRPRLGLGLRLVQGRALSRAVRARRPVRRPHAQARELVLRQRLRRPCVDGASGRAAAAGAHRRGGARPRASRVRRGGTYVCMEGPQFSSLRRVAHLQGPRLRRHRHDGDARGQARPRGRDHLRDHRHGDGLRLLAPRARRCRRGLGVIKVLQPERREGGAARRAALPGTSRRSTSPARSDPTARSTAPS